ncbi:hypothetical protein FA13DRAFT_1917452 [Coprinellus micaceus]|uniref:Uncharacterized protein n=1 Tax=Coprinellus micaceus TaxID=71717 RepID=A0A4Y7SM22_COPMI|nr:hypothetical protein FA13DRAFT_1917452 [Coprinellus micaceus]
MPLGVGLGTWTLNEDVHALRAEVDALREKVCNLRHEMKCLKRGKERHRGEVHSLRRKMGDLRVVVYNLRREKVGLGREVHRLTLMKSDIEAVVHDGKVELLELETRWDSNGGGPKRPYSPASSISSTELDAPKPALQAMSQADPKDAQIQTLKQENRALEARNRELADKYSESLRCLEKAQAQSCRRCSLRNTAASLTVPFVDRFENDRPPIRRVTESCCVPESSPRNPNRNRRQIILNDPPEYDGDPSGAIKVGGVNLDHSPGSNWCDLRDPTMVPGDSGLGDFCLTDSFFDPDDFEPVLL